MPPRPPRESDSDVHYEPLRASVLDVFEQLGAFEQDSGIVEWIFPEFHTEKKPQLRAKLTEVFDTPDPEPETPTKKSTTSRFFRLGTRSRSKSRSEKKDVPALPTPSKKPKKTRSSPNLRKDAAESETPAVPLISLPMKQASTSSSGANSSEHKPRRLSLFPRKSAAQSLDQPRPSISDEEWQQITMTGSIADYAVNPFVGSDPHGDNDAGAAKRDGGQKHYFSRFTHTFTRSTPTSPTSREHVVSPSPLSGPASPQATSDPTTPTGPPSPVPDAPPPVSEVPPSPAITTHSNGSTSTLTAAPLPGIPFPAPLSPEIQEVPTEVPLDSTSQMDHPRTSLSDISEGEASESSTLSVKNSRKSEETAADNASGS
ncbi:hypothetical protein B0H16DRAFT_1717701 [Mycena metata]|uniref:Uncharacterized protein n=1 Tax=Mycena metata TaxID=1033252 RepID=A0AAD7JLF8_9AGAR|nr:hypothetical protein B0H16DRAFT_1717701 [Mycena metata]